MVASALITIRLKLPNRFVVSDIIPAFNQLFLEFTFSSSCPPYLNAQVQGINRDSSKIHIKMG